MSVAFYLLAFQFGGVATFPGQHTIIKQDFIIQACLGNNPPGVPGVFGYSLCNYKILVIFVNQVFPAI